MLGDAGEGVFDDGAEEEFGHVAGSLPVDKDADVFETGGECHFGNFLDVRERHGIFKDENDGGIGLGVEVSFADEFTEFRFGIVRVANGVFDLAECAASGDDELIVDEDGRRLGFVIPGAGAFHEEKRGEADYKEKDGAKGAECGGANARPRTRCGQPRQRGGRSRSRE
jgi:hypothetical protein